jgi:hypothetical protein
MARKTGLCGMPVLTSVSNFTIVYPDDKATGVTELGM